MVKSVLYQKAKPSELIHKLRQLEPSLVVVEASYSSTP